MTNAVNLASAAGTGFFRNRLINGGMDVWQRGTSFSASGSNYYTADRWQTAGQTGTYSRSTDVPSGFKYSLSVAALSAAYGTVTQRIESINCVDLVGQAVTVSFYAKATTGGASGLTLALNYASGVDDFTSTVSIATATTAALTSSWTRYSATFTNLPANAANGLQISIFNSAGGSAAITWLVTGVQLEMGSVATAYERRSYGAELALCQRYYERINYVNTASLGSVSVGINYNPPAAGGIVIPFKTTKRTAPTCAISSVSHFTVSSVTCSGYSFGAAVDSVWLNLTVSTGNTGSSWTCVPVNANTSSAWIDASAEL